MKTLRRTFAVGVLALTLGGLVAPTASAAPTATPAGAAQAAVTHGFGVMKTWHATVQCQIVRISDNNVVKYDRADGTGNTEQAAINDAARNIPVPPGHYKRHCDAKRTW
ncbi:MULTISPECIES: hypothetical protein [unclassified Streptomyces]|uniref:hypothetical protein n=1 Tax=unclassified Streptomyces TaxID=2593676 RepID=UPI0036E36E42